MMAAAVRRPADALRFVTKKQKRIDDGRIDTDRGTMTREGKYGQLAVTMAEAQITTTTKLTTVVYV